MFTLLITGKTKKGHRDDRERESKIMRNYFSEKKIVVEAPPGFRERVVNLLLQFGAKVVTHVDSGENILHLTTTFDPGSARARARTADCMNYSVVQDHEVIASGSARNCISRPYWELLTSEHLVLYNVASQANT